MKRLIRLFSFYILFLTAVPCDARDNCCVEEICSNDRSALPSGNHQPGFPCSPFFACGANHAVVVPDGQIHLDRPYKPVKVSLFSSASPVSILTPPVWQPPKSA